MIEKFFSGELKNQIMKYCRKLETIASEYEVMIFMARKSICFYDALVLNEEIRDLNYKVVITTSSRILNYDCDFLKNKKIALIDDIVLKGNTLRETISFLQKKGIDNFDVYYIASQNFESENSKVIQRYLKEPILELDNNEILVLGNAVTGYISASACSYNVDYPVFYMEQGNEFYENYIQKNSCISIPSQSNGMTYMYVQNFNCYKYFEQFEIPELQDLKFKEKEIILKLRFFLRKDSGKRQVIVIPIIVLPELSKKQIAVIFRKLVATELDSMIKNIDEDKEIVNMLNVIQYILSYQLFVSVFQKSNGFKFEYSLHNQDYIFPKTYKERILKCLHGHELISEAYIQEVIGVDDFFALAETYRYFFDFIGRKHQKDYGHKIKFTFKDVYEYCTQINGYTEDEVRGNISILFDYAIDTGLIVPENFLNQDKCIRAYRLSEQYELHEKEFDLIIYMYNEYQRKTGKNSMNKILTEKLLVLFFRDVIVRILNEYKKNAKDDEKPRNLFGITYARFGPVVSESDEVGNVSKDSYLTKRLSDESRSPYKRLYEHDDKSSKKQVFEEGKMYVKKTEGETFKDLPEGWKRKTKSFVNKYNYIEEILNFYKIFEKLEYIKTFDKFLTISAVGNNRENQLLSLAAELKIYQKIICTKQSDEDIIFAVDSVIDGMVSGIWKFICYGVNEYQKCYKIIAEKVEFEHAKFEKYDTKIAKANKIKHYLERMEVSISENIEVEINTFLKVYAIYCNKDIEKYASCEKELKDAYSEPEKCKKIIIELLPEMIRKFSDYSLRLYQKRDVIKQQYIDLDKLEDLFVENNCVENRNYDMVSIVDKLMYQSAFIIYEILFRWNYVIENYKNKKITSLDRNKKYLSKAKEILSANDVFKEKINFIEREVMDIDKVVLRLKELEYEIDLILFCISQYVLKNESRFTPIHSFYIVRRDDGNVIEIDEMLANKRRENSLNKYLGIEGNDDCAAFLKSNQTIKLCQKLSEYSGYTLIEYECTRGCNILMKVGDACYSKRVKKHVSELLQQYTDKIIQVTDGEEECGR